jgi:hypothetical protein
MSPGRGEVSVITNTFTPKTGVKVFVKPGFTWVGHVDLGDAGAEVTPVAGDEALGA